MREQKIYIKKLLSNNTVRKFKSMGNHFLIFFLIFKGIFWAMLSIVK